MIKSKLLYKRGHYMTFEQTRRLETDIKSSHYENKILRICLLLQNIIRRRTRNEQSSPHFEKNEREQIAETQINLRGRAFEYNKLGFAVKFAKILSWKWKSANGSLTSSNLETLESTLISCAWLWDNIEKNRSPTWLSKILRQWDCLTGLTHHV